MAKYHGRGGALLMGAANAGAATLVQNLTEWSVNQEMDLVEVSSLGDSAKTFVAGMKDIKADMSGYFSDSEDVPFDAFDQAITGGTVNLYLYPAGTSVAEYIYGAVWPKSVEISTSVNGAVTFTCGVQFNGTATRVG